MKNLIYSAAIAIALSQSAMAVNGQENEGVSLCSSAKYVCQDTNGSVVVCAFAENGYVDITSQGDSTSYNFPMTETPFEPGVLGAGDHYKGANIELDINTDVPESAEGFPANLSIPSLSIKNEKVGCKLNERR